MAHTKLRTASTTSLVMAAAICLVLDCQRAGSSEQENAAEEQFGVERVAELVRQIKDRSMTELMETIYREVRAHRAEVDQTDDVTVLLVRRLPD